MEIGVGAISVAQVGNIALTLSLILSDIYTRKMSTSRARLPKKLTFEPGDYV